MIDTTPSPPPRPPVIERPAAYEVSYGVVQGIAARGTRRVLVRIDGKVVRELPLRGRTFSLDVPLPQREVRVRVETVDARDLFRDINSDEFCDDLWSEGADTRFYPSVRSKHADGRAQMHALNMTPIRDAQGQPSRFLAVILSDSFQSDAAGGVKARVGYDPLTKLPDRSLLADRVVELGLAEACSYETIRRALKKTPAASSSRGRKRSGASRP